MHVMALAVCGILSLPAPARAVPVLDSPAVGDLVDKVMSFIEKVGEMTERVAAQVREIKAKIGKVVNLINQLKNLAQSIIDKAKETVDLINAINVLISDLEEEILGCRKRSVDLIDNSALTQASQDAGNFTLGNMAASALTGEYQDLDAQIERAQKNVDKEQKYYDEKNRCRFSQIPKRSC